MDLNLYLHKRTMNSDEHILLRKLREGDTEALDILYLRYAAKVRDFAFRLLGDSVELPASTLTKQGEMYINVK